MRLSVAHPDPQPPPVALRRRSDLDEEPLPPRPSPVSRITPVTTTGTISAMSAAFLALYHNQGS